MGINNDGQIVGYFTDTSFHDHGFLKANGTIATIDIPNSAGTQILGINNVGQIVGTYAEDIDFRVFHAFLGSNGSFTGIDGRLARPFGINDAGQIVGSYVTDNYHGFLYDRGELITITVDTPGGFFTIPKDINDSGVITGTYLTSEGFGLGSHNVSHGFIATPTPEPASLVLIMCGAACLGIVIRRTRIPRASADH